MLITLLVTFLSLCISSTQVDVDATANSLYKVSLHTGNWDKSCDMDENGAAWIVVIGNDHTRCQTPHLNNPGDDYEKGHTDVYTGSLLGNCLNTDFSEGVFQFEVHHSGTDGWCLDWATLEMRTGHTMTCYPNAFLDDNDYATCSGSKQD